MCAMGCIVISCRCVVSLNEGRLMLNWKQDFLEDLDNNLSSWNGSDGTPCL